jgi:hypothetical protein
VLLTAGTTYVPTYLPTYLYTYLHTYLPTYSPTYIPTYLYTCIYTHVFTYIHAYLPTYVHTYLYTYLHTYLHIYLSIYGSTVLCWDIGHFFSVLISYTVARTAWSGDQPVAWRYPHTDTDCKRGYVPKVCTVIQKESLITTTCTFDDGRFGPNM